MTTRITDNGSHQYLRDWKLKKGDSILGKNYISVDIRALLNNECVKLASICLLFNLGCCSNYLPTQEGVMSGRIRVCEHGKQFGQALLLLLLSWYRFCLSIQRGCLGW